MTLLAPLLALALAAPGQAPSDPATPAPPVATSRPTPRPLPASPLAPDGAEAWQMTLPEAIRLGLIHSEVVRVVAVGTRGVLPAGYADASIANPGVPARPAVGNDERIRPAAAGPNDADIVVSRLDADGSIWRFEASLLAHVRSVEQQYWALAQQHVGLWARETAARIGEELLREAQAGLAQGRVGPEAVAEAEQQLQNFRLDLVTATADLITTERQLRNILGLPAADNRRIVPATAPLEAQVGPDWDESVRRMLAFQPEVAQQREAISGVALLAALDPKVAADAAQDRRGRDRQQDLLRQVVRDSTHSLARFFAEIDANFKQFRAAQKARAAGQGRLEAQRAAFGRGEVAIDRVLDAVAQYANATTQEAQYRSSYNTSIAAFEEAQGTLLARDGVIVALPANPARPATADAPAPAAASTYRVRAAVAGWKLLDVEVEVNRPAPAPR